MDKRAADLRREIESYRFEPEQWLWCMHCERFFQGKDARPDGLGVQGCAFAECDGAGYQIDIFDWDAWPRSASGAVAAKWPRLRELHKGLRAASWDAEDEALQQLPVVRDPNFVRNRDRRRRDVILGVDSRGPRSARAAFTGLDLPGLAMLLHERLVAPWDGAADFPSVNEFLRFLAHHPEVRLFGHVTHPKRGDTHVAIEGMECALGDVSPARREALSRAFEVARMDGAEMEETDALLRATFKNPAPAAPMTVMRIPPPPAPYAPPGAPAGEAN